jgi:hypothetical protein
VVVTAKYFADEAGIPEVMIEIDISDELLNPVIWKEQVYWRLWERLPAAIV